MHSVTSFAKQNFNKNFGILNITVFLKLDLIIFLKQIFDLVIFCFLFKKLFKQFIKTYINHF